MDLVKILGGLALGATGAALYDALRASKAMSGDEMGQGLVIGPPSDGGGGETGDIGPIISVTPEIVGSGLPGGSFFGISASPWFLPLNVNWLYPRPPLNMVCVKRKTEDEEILVCEESYGLPVRRRYPGYAWGPPSGWL